MKKEEFICGNCKLYIDMDLMDLIKLEDGKKTAYCKDCSDKVFLVSEKN